MFSKDLSAQLLVATFFLIPVIAHPITKNCKSTCDFDLCSPAKVSLLSSAGESASPPICLEGRPVGVTKTGEAFVRSGASYYALLSRADSKKCSPHFFKTYKMDGGASGVGFDGKPGTDVSFLAGKCVALPLEQVQLISHAGTAVHELKLEGRPLKDCVGFEVDWDVPQSASYYKVEAGPKLVSVVGDVGKKEEEMIESTFEEEIEAEVIPSVQPSEEPSLDVPLVSKEPDEQYEEEGVKPGQPFIL